VPVAAGPSTADDTIEARGGVTEARIAVISDTHGRLARRVLESCAGADHIIHAGDVGSMAVLEELSRVARQDYGLAGAVQHGASTLPPDAFDAFPRVGACEIHLATDFQNMVYEHPMFPADLKAEMYAWIREHATEERKPKDTEEQFIYKARKKALGPFKRRLWSMPDTARQALGRSLEERFTFLMKQLKIDGTASVVTRFVQAKSVPVARDAEILAAGGTITAAERKAEGLAD